MPSKVEYDGKTYSGSYGDLGAMAIPLHPKARSSDVDAKYSCTLRESMVKVIHSVSAVKYRDAHDTYRVQTLAGCRELFPFLALSVFNFKTKLFMRTCKDRAKDGVR